jgi:hypothetical protein
MVNDPQSVISQSNAELELNRQGKLSSAQEAYLKRSYRGYVAESTLGILFFSAVVVLGCFLGLQDDSTCLFSSLMVLVGIWAIGSISLGIMEAQASIEAKEVFSIKGTITKKHHERRQWIKIADKNFSVSLWEYKAFTNHHPYEIFYVGRWILRAEPLKDENF